MAENDKFEYGLPKYWSKAHRLACANSSIPAIVDEITTGARLTLGREASCRAICQLADLLQQLKPAETTTAQTQIFGDWDYRHEYLEVQLEQLNVGTSNARAAHPATLLRFNRLLASLIGDSVRVWNPFWDITIAAA